MTLPASPGKAGAQHLAACNWAPAFAGEERWWAGEHA